MTTWLRRNVLALLALPLLMVGLAAPDVEELYHVWWAGQPILAVTGAKDEIVHIGAASVRMVELSSASLTVASTHKPVNLPPGYRFWKSRLSVTLSGPMDLGLCEITLEDQRGRRYSDDPDQLSPTNLFSGRCVPEDKSDLAFDITSYFLLPPGAQPSAVRLVAPPALPHYVRLLA